MSTDYTHFDKLAFNNLFAHGPDGSETLIINSSGVFVGVLTFSGALSVKSITTSSNGTFTGKVLTSTIQSTGTLSLSPGNAIVTVNNELHANGVFIGDSANRINHLNSIITTSTLAVTGAVSVSGKFTSSAGSAASAALTVASAGLGLYRAGAKQLGFAAGSTNIATITTAALLVAKALTVTGAASASNLSGTNTGDNVNASSSTAGIISTGTQSFAGTKTFVTPLAGTNIASASSAASGVVTTGSQSFAGTKTFVTPLTGTNVASASTSASGVVTTGTQSFAGSKTFSTSDFEIVSNASQFSRILCTGTVATRTSQLRIQTAAGGGDAYITLAPLGSVDWSIGQDVSDSGTLTFDNGATPGSNTRMSITQAGVITLGSGSSTQHALNTLLATNGVQVATLANLPAAATAGNPFGWFKITVNGTTSYIPFWH